MGNIAIAIILTFAIGGAVATAQQPTKIPRIGYLSGSSPSTSRARREAFRQGLRELGYEVVSPRDIETAFRAATQERAGAVLLVTSPVVFSQRTQFADLAVKNRLPAAYSFPKYVQDGGLMSYGPSFTDLFRRAATYVDKILKGRTPADLPVEQPIKFEFIVNLKAAKQIGLTIPPNVLARADKVIR